MNHHADQFPWRMGVAVLHDAGEVIKEFIGAQDSIPDRRKSARFPLHIPIRYRVKGKCSDLDAAETVNVSEGGIRFMTMQKDIKSGMQIELMMKLPGVSYVIELIGTVVWAKAAAQQGFAMECGVVFESAKQK